MHTLAITVESFENQYNMGLAFIFESDASKIIPILKKRLPKSANIYNMCKTYDNFLKPEEMAFYVMCTTIDKSDSDVNSSEESVWIMAPYYREDHGMRYALSAPQNPIITPEIKDTFVKCPYIDWNKEYHFSCVDFGISPMIMEISTQIMGNFACSMPCKVFTMNKDQAANLDVTISDTFFNDVVLKPLDKVKGAEFICNTWKYAVPGTTKLVFEKLLCKNKSMGLYDQNGNVICGMCMNDCGLLGNLYCLPEHRGKGYASLVARKLMKSLVVEEVGAVPCSAVEFRNHNSIVFHEKLGMSVSHFVEFIKYVPQSW